MGALALTLAACGSDNATGESTTTESTGSETTEAPALSGELVGAGASSQEAAMNAWIAEFQNLNPDVNVSYDPVGSGGGRTQFIEGGTDFGGTDAYLDDEELAGAEARCGEGGVIELPLYISPIAVIYNLPSVDAQLQMSAETIAKVFNGDITKWNDAAIAAENAGVELPDLAITVAHRSDESGTTENFTEYLVAAAGAAWPHEASGDWPVAGQQSAQGTSGVVGLVESAEGTIGYADASRAGSLGTVAVGVGDEYVPYSAEAAAAVVEASARVEGRGDYNFAIDLARDTTASGAYPIVLVSYTMACTSYDDQNTADLVKAFLGYVSSAEGQEVSAAAAGSAPISDALRQNAQSAIDAISAS